MTSLGSHHDVAIITPGPVLRAGSNLTASCWIPDLGVRPALCSGRWAATVPSSLYRVLSPTSLSMALADSASRQASGDNLVLSQPQGTHILAAPASDRDASREQSILTCWSRNTKDLTCSWAPRRKGEPTLVPSDAVRRSVRITLIACYSAASPGTCTSSALWKSGWRPPNQLGFSDVITP
ncbi:cytokine receptor-like factor 1 isoform X1 [Lates japonicus]|uniref:Cytokine receptor-like factor 1 isoform X1 n=1 Tax=Lates japonicus TaxID=270547 RepID=A0AAD3M5S4_LATJO|nr:cytokine receptor-like factor 1 isoform X1 [Lates japonicus]